MDARESNAARTPSPSPAGSDGLPTASAVSPPDDPAAAPAQAVRQLNLPRRPRGLPLSSEAPGATVGPYKLLQQIGEGGFGVVFLAEQEHPVRRKVALKVIKPGMDTK